MRILLKGSHPPPPQEQDISGAQAPIQEQEEVPQATEQDQGQAQSNGGEPIIEAKIKLKQVIKIKFKKLSLHKQRKSKFGFLHEEFNLVKKNLKRRDKKRL